MRTINIAVVDSNFSQRRSTLVLLDEYLLESHIRARIEWFNSGYGLLEDVKSNGGYDLYLVDPIMPDVNGILLVKQLRKEGDRGKVIFVSANKSYAFNAFEVKAFDYIAKPIEKARLYSALDSAIQDIINNMVIPVVELELQTGYKRVPADSILYIDIVDRALCFHLENGEKYPSKCLRGGFQDAVEKYLEQPWFVMSGVSHLVNVARISVLNKRTAIMTNGEIVPITEASYKTVRKMWKETKL